MRDRRLAALLTVLGAAAPAACTLGNVNTDPVIGAFHYPIAGAISQDGNYLYVANSNFNLAYSSGTLNVVDLTRVRAAIHQANGAPTPPCVPPLPYSTVALSPERRAYDVFCESQFITSQNNVSTVRIGTFATAAAMSPHGNRLYITVRGDGSLTWIDLANGGASLSCGANNGEPCDANHRRAAPGSTRGARMLTMPALPIAIDVGIDGFIAVAHQETPRSHVSLFVDGTAAGVNPDGPDLAHWIPDLSLYVDALLRLDPGGTDPTMGFNPNDPATRPYWWALSRAEPFISHVRAVPDTGSPDRSYLVRQMVSPLVGIASDVGVRYIRRDPCNPNIAYATARGAPVDTGTAARSGDQLLKIDLTDPTNPTVIDVMAMAAGPSQLVAFNQHPADCSGHTMLYTVSYDARQIYAVDVTEWRPVDQIRTQAGPNAILLDPMYGTADHNYLYVIDFVAMCVEVIDLDPSPAHAATYNRVVFTVGDIVPTQVNL